MVLLSKPFENPDNKIATIVMENIGTGQIHALKNVMFKAQGMLYFFDSRELLPAKYEYVQYFLALKTCASGVTPQFEYIVPQHHFMKGEAEITEIGGRIKVTGVNRITEPARPYLWQSGTNMHMGVILFDGPNNLDVAFRLYTTYDTINAVRDKVMVYRTSKTKRSFDVFFQK